MKSQADLKNYFKVFGYEVIATLLIFKIATDFDNLVLKSFLQLENSLSYELICFILINFFNHSFYLSLKDYFILQSPYFFFFNSKHYFHLDFPLNKYLQFFDLIINHYLIQSEHPVFLCELSQMLINFFYFFIFFFCLSIQMGDLSLDLFFK